MTTTDSSWSYYCDGRATTALRNRLTTATATYHFVYDDQWRIVGTYRDSDSSPKERFVYHNAGNDGYGSASYIDAAVLRDRDKNAGWTSASDGTLEERIYYCQNWRADVVAIIDNSKGGQAQMDRYGEYGEAFGMPAGDTEGDGDVDAADLFTIQNWVGLSYDVRGDVDLDGDVDSTDLTAATGNSGTTLGWGKLSLAVGATAGGNRKGYAGYENDGVLANAWFYHVKHRVYHAGLGRWVTVDPLGYVDGTSLFQYVSGRPLSATDPQGLTMVGDIACLAEAINAPLPSTSPACADYGSIVHCDDDWWHIPLLPPGLPAPCFFPICMCSCMGDSPWDQFVRSCLHCMYLRHYDLGPSHEWCFAMADAMFPGGSSLPSLTACLARCQIQSIAIRGDLLPRVARFLAEVWP